MIKRSVTKPPLLFITKRRGVTKDQLKEMIDKYDEEYKDVKGFTHSAEYKDDYMVEKQH